MDPVTALAAAAALCAALIGGLFFVFSVAVMPALGRLPAAHGIAAMQSINLVILNRWFLPVFLGTGALCLGLAVVALLRWGEAGAGAMLAGSLLYLLGTLAVTMAFNVPRNEALARVEPSSEEGAATWARYLASWTAWNHVRTAAALAGAACFLAALMR